MRLIKEFKDKKIATRFSLFLQEKNIENSLEKEGEIYQIWVHNEDQLQEAKNYLKDFEKDPQNESFTVNIKDEKTHFKKESSFSFFLTSFFLVLCIFIYFINLTQEMSIKKKDPSIKYVVLTPIQNSLLYDKPYLLIEIEKIIKKYKIDPAKEIENSEAQLEIENAEKKDFWTGFYDVIVKKKKIKGPFFEKIKQGEVWRIFTPCVLHKGLLHLLFNMLWLLVLGKQIEERLSKYKYLILIIILGIITNTFQYLMSGPYFLGFSGVIMGMVGFIWSRQKKAPWEGYPLSKPIFIFIGVYVILMFILSFFSFAAEALNISIFTFNIANTAHIVGAISGWLLGKIPFFARKVI